MFCNVLCEPIYSTDAPKEIPTTSVASIFLAESPTSDSRSISTTVDNIYETQAPEAVEITDDQPKIKRRRIKHDVLVKAEVLQKKDDGMATADFSPHTRVLISIKQKYQNRRKIKKTALRLLLTFRKRSCSKSALPSNIKFFTRNCMLSSRKLSIKDIM